MEPFRAMLTKEAFQDNNFGDGMFKGNSDADDKVLEQSDISKGNRRGYLTFRRNVMIEFRKQYKNTKSSLDEFAIHALEGFDDVVGNTLTPSTCLNCMDQNPQKFDLKGSNADSTDNGDLQDPDKVFRKYPSFDPVFMKV